MYLWQTRLDANSPFTFRYQTKRLTQSVNKGSFGRSKRRRKRHLCKDNEENKRSSTTCATPHFLEVASSLNPSCLRPSAEEPLSPRPPAAGRRQVETPHPRRRKRTLPPAGLGPRPADATPPPAVEPHLDHHCTRTAPAPGSPRSPIPRRRGHSPTSCRGPRRRRKRRRGKRRSGQTRRQRRPLRPRRAAAGRRCWERTWLAAERTTQGITRN